MICYLLDSSAMNCIICNPPGPTRSRICWFAASRIATASFIFLVHSVSAVSSKVVSPIVFVMMLPFVVVVVAGQPGGADPPVFGFALLVYAQSESAQTYFLASPKKVYRHRAAPPGQSQNQP
jgi:hypothetical protein